jgi:uncharacterized protein YndB with AHSA1/START domain
VVKRAEVGRTRDAGWQIGVSKTLDHSVEDVWAFLTSPAGTAIWLGPDVTVSPEPGVGYETADGVHGETRSFTRHRRIRLTWQPSDWPHDTTLQLSVTPAGDDRARLGVHQERLVDAAERDRQRTHWQAVINAVVEAMGRGRADRSAAGPA